MIVIATITGIDAAPSDVTMTGAMPRDEDRSSEADHERAPPIRLLLEPAARVLELVVLERQLAFSFVSLTLGSGSQPDTRAAVKSAEAPLRSERVAPDGATGSFGAEESAIISRRRIAATKEAQFDKRCLIASPAW